MKHFLRPYHGIGIVVLLGVVAAPPGARAQSTQIIELLEGTSPLLLHNSSQGYLGVDVADVDQDKAQALKLKEVRGAVITLIDHDAPAGQIGLKVNDVVLQLNGQNVEGAEQLRRMLKEIPPGRKVSLEFSRDGNIQTTSVQLVDHRAMEHDVWNKLGKDSEDNSPMPGMGVLPGAGDNELPGMFHMPIWGSTLNVGALVEPLTSQMAEYLGIPNGLMVKQVARKSEAASAGLKAFDVILKVGADAVTTMSDWDRALRSNQGKPVQVTILRDRKQQTLTLQVDSKRKTGELEMEELFPNDECAQFAELDPQQVQMFAEDTAKAAEALKDQLKLDTFQFDQKQMDDMKQQMEQFGKNFKAEDFKLDQKQFDDLKQQMEQFGKNFKMEDFKFDQKQMDDLKQQMEQFRKDFKPEGFQVAPN
jgi:membrane-associated protease RseP (regulator of RpoE activity)